MTFEELFKKALDTVDTTKEYCGRTEAIDAFVESLKLVMKEHTDKSKWETIYVSNPYGKENPYIFLNAHGASLYIYFKVKLKKSGTVYKWYSGTNTCYIPIAASTCIESVMNEDVLEYFNSLYDNSDSVKEHLAEEKKTQDTIKEYAELIERYKSVANEINNLSLEVKGRLRKSDLPYISFY